MQAGHSSPDEYAGLTSPELRQQERNMMMMTKGNYLLPLQQR